VADAQGTHAFGEHRTDREGQVTLDFPPEGITQFTLLARARGYLARQEIVPGNRLPSELTYGGTGRPVIGKVVLDDPKQKIDWSSGHHTHMTRYPKPPEETRTPAAIRAWQQSGEYKEAVAKHRTYMPDWQADGSFRIEDVPAGRHVLQLNFIESADDWSETSLGSINREVEIPDIPGGQTDDPLDLGELTLAVLEAVRKTLGDPVRGL